MGPSARASLRGPTLLPCTPAILCTARATPKVDMRADVYAFAPLWDIYYMKGVRVALLQCTSH